MTKELTGLIYTVINCNDIYGSDIEEFTTNNYEACIDYINSQPIGQRSYYKIEEDFIFPENENEDNDNIELEIIKDGDIPF